MQVLYPRCAGLDVHKDTVVACVRCVSPPHASGGAQLRHHHHAGLLALADWLAEHGCTHVAMEATGVYWKPVWHVLEDELRAGAGQRRSTSATCPGARPTSTTRCGSPICSPTA